MLVPSRIFFFDLQSFKTLTNYCDDLYQPEKKNAKLLGHSIVTVGGHSVYWTNQMQIKIHTSSKEYMSAGTARPGV